mmetsp:Transcript_17324/g.32863  ORF Transcript_17324/g.32863 Transcript_17324/m.32863 type:complete len:203 (+) Transcript_17324:61-669(+)
MCVCNKRLWMGLCELWFGCFPYRHAGFQGVNLIAFCHAESKLCQEFTISQRLFTNAVTCHFIGIACLAAIFLFLQDGMDVGLAPITNAADAVSLQPPGKRVLGQPPHVIFQDIFFLIAIDENLHRLQKVGSVLAKVLDHTHFVHSDLHHFFIGPPKLGDILVAFDFVHHCSHFVVGDFGKAEFFLLGDGGRLCSTLILNFAA